MSPLKSTRLAWGVAFASLALWAFSAPVSWGQAAAGTHRLFDDNQGTNTPTDSTSVISIQQDTSVTSSSSGSGDSSADTSACPPLAQVPAIAQVLPTITTPTAPAPAVTTTSGSSNSGTFHICGPDPQAEQAISQLLAGRGFSASLSARSDGCADLTITPTSPGATSGSASTNLNVSVGSGRNLSIKIVSQGGASHASIGLS